MKVLIIGDCNSIHIVNFMRVVLKRLDKLEITLFDMNAQGITNKEAYEYYQKNNIKIVINNGLVQIVKSNLIRKIPKLRVLVHLMLLNRKISELGDFDYCLIHFVDVIKAKIVVRNKNKYRNIIPVFWGSDLLRNKKIESSYFRKLFQLSYKIVFNTENMKRNFKNVYKKEFDSKVEVIKFPTMSFGKIKHLQKASNLESVKKSLALPKDKLIVICGHSGTKEEQYEKLIDSISMCSEYVKKKCYFVFLMTYGRSDLKDYQNDIKGLINKNNINGIVLSNYTEHDEILKLFICSNIYISTITTDAFSGVMQENLYSGAMLIYGKWLKYYEIENSDIVAQSVQTISDVTHSLQDVVMNYDKIKPRLKQNAELISSISSPQIINEMWRKKVFKN